MKARTDKAWVKRLDRRLLPVSAIFWVFGITLIAAYIVLGTHPALPASALIGSVVVLFLAATWERRRR